MAYTKSPGGDPLRKIKPPKQQHRKGRIHKGGKGRNRKQKKPHTKSPKTIHARPQPAERGASDPGNPAPTGAVSGSGAPMPAREVEAAALGASVDTGLLGAVLQLAGSADLSGTALVTWQREQDRLANRAWRRPGGLQRMGGL